jgi:hypothetical protein
MDRTIKKDIICLNDICNKSSDIKETDNFLKELNKILNKIKINNKYSNIDLYVPK